MLFAKMINLELMLFFLILMGLYAKKKGFLTDGGVDNLTDILISITLPCSILMSFVGFSTEGFYKEAAILVLISFCISTTYVLLSFILYRKVAPDKSVVLQYATIVTNANFIGFPIVEGVFGTVGMLYASIATIPLRIYTWSLGVSIYSGEKSETGFKLVKKLVTHPCILSIIIGFAIMGLHIPMPEFLGKGLSYLGNCTTPLSMMLIGSMLAETKSIKILFQKDILVFTLIRLIILPCTALLILKALGVHSLLAGVPVLIYAMPAGGTTPILAQKYGRNAEFAAALVCSSTLFSLFTIPVLSVFL